MTTPITGTETVTPAQVLTADINSPIVTDGAQPVVSSPVVDGNPTAPVVAADPTVTPPAADPNAGDEAPKITPKWAQDRINELTAKRYDGERRAKAAEDRAAAAEELLAKMVPATAPSVEKPVVATPPAVTEQEIERRVVEKAAQIARQTEFNKACNAIADAGEKEFKDWGDALKNLTLVGATGENATPDFLETAVELKSPHKVLHYLGTNLDEAKRITEMPPKKMALEMARLEATLNAPAVVAPVPISAAPAPVIPVNAAAKVTPGDINDPNLSPDEWYALRAKQIEERKSRYRRV